MSDIQKVDPLLIKSIFKVIKKETGIIIRNERLTDFEIVIRGRIITNKLNQDSYLQFFKNNDDEIIKLASFFTIQETSFYRNKSHFDRLREQIIPDLIKKKTLNNNKKLTILSAGCASGEEPYTIAMILDQMHFQLKGWDIKIIATDIYDKALDEAKKGVYSEYKLRNLDSSLIDKYFQCYEHNYLKLYKINKALKHKVEFLHVNLIKEPFQLGHLQDVDIVFCENVIIYFNIESIQRLINNFHVILSTGGYLFLGYSETLNIIKHNFDLSWWKGSYAYHKRLNRTPVQPVISSPKTMLPGKNSSYNSNAQYNNLIFLARQYYFVNNISNVALILEEIETKLLPINEHFYIIKAEFLFDKKDYINAAHYCHETLNFNPYFLGAHLLLCNIYLELDMLDKFDFEIKITLYVNNQSVLAYYFCYHYNMKKVDSASCNHNIEKIKTVVRNSDYVFADNSFPLNGKRRKLIIKEIKEIIS